MPAKLSISNHPLVQHKLSLLRDRNISQKEFRELCYEIGILLGTEATRDLLLVPSVPLEHPIRIETVKIAEKIALVPILRAGLGLVDALLHLLPIADVLHLGLYRDKNTLKPVEYYNKLPDTCQVDQCIILDPMLATAGTAIAAVSILKDWGVKNIKLVSLVASRSGIQALEKAHPDVSVFVAAVDSELSQSGYIVPGLGDAGDRLFNRKD